MAVLTTGDLRVLQIIVVATTLLIGCGEVDGRPERLPVAAGCDPSAEPCVAGTAQRGLSLFLHGGTLKALEPFTVQVRLFGLEAGEVAVAFQMEGMDMGRNRFALTPQGSGLWAGEGMLPVCWSGRLDWSATVELRRDEHHSEAEFRFSLKG